MRRALSLVLLLSTLGGCRGATQITVEVTTDLQCKDLQSTSITVGTIATVDAKFSTSVTSHCEGDRIGALVVVPSGDDGAELALRVVTGLHGKDPDACVRDGYAGDCIVARRALHFSPHTTRTVDVVMRDVCAGIACNAPDAFATCVQGACVSARCPGDDCSEGSLLPNPPGLDAGADATLDGGAPGTDAALDASTDAGPPSAWLDMASPASLPFAGRAGHVAVWTGSRMLVWGGALEAQFADDGASYDPIGDAWTLLPAAQLAGRDLHTAVWTGSEMIVWGGTGNLDTGARYDPAQGAWRQLPTPPVDGRGAHSAIWATTTGEMVVFGGDGPGGLLADGAAYAPSTNTWRKIAASPLQARASHGAVWNGARMIVFGGSGCGSICGDASSYDPAQDKWLDIAAVPAALDARLYPIPLATGPNGTLATFFGGGINGVGGARATGATYDATTNAWSPIEGLGTAVLADPAREHPLAWWGAGRLWFWGGTGTGGAADTKSDGAAYDPATHSWAKIPAGGPSKRASGTVVWTGTEAILWGGSPDGLGALVDGKRFRP